MISSFLPESYDSQKSVALIAGKGRYPQVTLDKMEARKIPSVLIAFEGETAPELWERYAKDKRVMIKVGQLGKLLKYLKHFGAGYAIMAGQITPKKLFKGLHPDLKAITLMAKLKQRNAETIFGTIAREIEKIGVAQLDARAFLEDELADLGLMTPHGGRFPYDSLEYGVSIAKEIARLDIGQGVVVSRGTVLAVEAFEGTDAMLKRAGTFEAKDALFVKTVKPKQDYRFDVPVFGLHTLKVMQEAGLYYAALEAQKTILLDKQELIRRAAKAKIHLYGY